MSRTKPAFSKPRLDHMHQVLSGYIDRKEMPGLVALVSRHDDVHVETLGTLSFSQSGSDANRHHLSYRFTREARYRRRRDDSGGRMPVTSRRIHRTMAPRTRQSPGTTLIVLTHSTTPSRRCARSRFAIY